MKRRSAVVWALDEVRRHPLRTFLVAQGMIWGVALSIIPAAVIEGSRRRGIERAAELGTDLIQVSEDPSRPRAAPPREADLAAVVEILPSGSRWSALRVEAARIAVLAQGGQDLPGTATRDSERRDSEQRASEHRDSLHRDTQQDAQPAAQEATAWLDVWLLGCDAQLPLARGARLLVGRFPDLSVSGGEPRPSTEGVAASPPAADPAQEVEVCLEATLAHRLTRSTSPDSALGIRLWMTRPEDESPILRLEPPQPEPTRLTRASPGLDPPVSALCLRVVGVVEDEVLAFDPLGQAAGRSFTRTAQTLQRILGVAPPAAPWRDSGHGIYLPRAQIPGDRLDWLYLRVPPLEVGAIASRLEGVLGAAGRESLIYVNSFWPILTAPELEGYLVLHDILFALFTGVGLAVLANLLLLAGWQRRHEIALRRTEGAARADIFFQFLWEGVLVAVCGWVGGVAAGMGLAWLRVTLDPNVVAGLSIPWGAVVRGGSILALATLLVAAYPAWRASGHHPMTLLRGM